MKNFIITITILIFSISIITAQHAPRNYRAEREKVNNLIHTKLKVSLDFNSSQLYGEEWLTLAPHFYPTNKVVLDAKAMLIHKVQLNGSDAQYNYSDNELTIELDKTYSKDEKYTLYINYTAQPEKVVQKGSKAIKDAKGLYFIDPLDTDPNKPTQVWTQGETESSSCWFPTIDSPNQKTTQEIYVTVPSKYVTLSNGKMISSTDNADNTRTDYWKMDQKHAPYLFFLGIGEYSIVKDTYKGKSVDYYVEKEYEPYARAIFGKTPKMMQFYSDITGVEYQWDKYSQIVGRDYISGAMENTTAVLHQEDAYQVPGQLIDQNGWEKTIAHELFHHWFGDLVTTESWSNLTVNESFANYGEYLWLEHEYGKDIAEEHLYNNTKMYFDSNSEAKDLVRFKYDDKEDMFDLVSYNKGGHILHMLRNYLGDDAFYASLNKYLEDNKYGTGEAHQFRLAAEAVSGKDLNWFFNQWYFGNGHIKMNVSYDYNTLQNTVTVTVNQNTKAFVFPLTITVYEQNGETTHNVLVDAKEKSFTFNYGSKPVFIDVDPERILLAQVTENKTLENYIYQYKKGKSFISKREALLEIAKHQDKNEAFDVVSRALNDDFYRLRILALENIDLFQKYNKKQTIQKIEKLAQNDPKTLVKAKAMEVLGKLLNPVYKPLFEKGLQNESFSVIGSSLLSLYLIDKEAAISNSKSLSEDVKKYIGEPIVRLYIQEKDKTQLPFIAKHVLKGMFLTNDKSKQQTYGEAFKWIAESDNVEAIINLTTELVTLGNQYKKYNFDKLAINFMQQIIAVQNKSTNSNKDQINEIIRTGMAKLIE